MRFCNAVLPKCELNKENINRHAKVEGGKPTRLHPYTKNSRQLVNTESDKNSPLQGKEHLLAIQYQMSNQYQIKPEHIHTRNII